MSCRPAPACRAALEEATKRWPQRSRVSDGTCASSTHTYQNPTSDHEPDTRGIAHAFDLTHDPTHGVDCSALVGLLIEARDPRIKYVIWRRQIWRSYDKPGLPAWTAQPYTGTNPHDKHMHVSVLAEQENNVSTWWAPIGVEDEMTPAQEAKLDEALALLRGIGTKNWQFPGGDLTWLDQKIAAQLKPLGDRLAGIEAKLGD